MPSVIRPSSLRLLLLALVCLARAACPPAAARAAGAADLVAPSEAAVYEVWEARLAPGGLPEAARRADPFDPEAVALDAVVTPPSGEAFRVPLFLGRDYARERVRGQAERLLPDGEPGWRLRVAPRETGRHAVRIELRLGNEPAARVVAETAFRATAATSPGFLRADPEAPATLVFDDGTRLRWIGHNLAWVGREEGTFGFDRELAALADAGGNAARVWLCTWGLSLDTRAPLRIDLADAWRLDHVFRTAATRNIHLMLTLDNFHDFRESFEESPFHAGNGGPCPTRVDFFLSGDARAQYRARLRYLVGRYGAFRSLLAWELWNEVNYALTLLDRLAYPERLPPTRQILVDWTARAAGDLRALDPYRHPVTTSLGDNAVWPSLWELPEMDLVQIHGYIDRTPLHRPPVETDAAAFVLELHDRAAAFGKPAVVSEFGYAGDGSVSPLNPRDPRGIAFHNALWAGAIGAGGTPLHWWWDGYIGPYGLAEQYRPLADFLSHLPPRTVPVAMRERTGGFDLLALRTPDAVLLWVRNRAHTWHRVLVEKTPPGSAAVAELVLEDFPAGTWAATWIDPWSGRTLREETLRAPEGRMRLATPPVRRDVACRLIRIGRASAPPSTPR